MSSIDFPSTYSVVDSDPRYTWLKSTITNLLGVFEPEYVNMLLAQNYDAFTDFLDAKYTKYEELRHVVLYVWRTFYDKMVEEEITVLEEGELP